MYLYLDIQIMHKTYFLLVIQKQKYQFKTSIFVCIYSTNLQEAFLVVINFPYPIASFSWFELELQYYWNLKWFIFLIKSVNRQIGFQRRNTTHCTDWWTTTYSSRSLCESTWMFQYIPGLCTHWCFLLLDTWHYCTMIKKFVSHVHKSIRPNVAWCLRKHT